MEMWFRNSFFILIFSPFTSACSLDMIVGAEDENFQYREPALRIVPAFRTHLSPYENPRLSEQFTAKNQTALQLLNANIKLLNRSNPAFRHTLVTENNDISLDYADYIKNWKLALEFYVNSNYPKGMKYQEPNGNALVDVAVTKSGRLHSYDILLTTGSPNLNTAIDNIIKHNTPFAPLNANITKNTDVLHITQMWQFRH
ncbi:MAG: hypothetical protein ACC657_04335 [Thiohalomonadales bacterium]